LEVGRGEMNENRVSVQKAKYKRSLRKDRRKWEDSIKIYFKEMACINVDWIHLDQFRKNWRTHVNSVIPSEYVNCEFS
jgi:hypothetical protein